MKHIIFIRSLAHCPRTSSVETVEILLTSSDVLSWSMERMELQQIAILRMCHFTIYVLFWSGSGTFFKIMEPVHSHESLEEVDCESLFKLIERSVWSFICASLDRMSRVHWLSGVFPYSLQGIWPRTWRGLSHWSEAKTPCSIPCWRVSAQLWSICRINYECICISYIIFNYACMDLLWCRFRYFYRWSAFSSSTLFLPSYIQVYGCCHYY